MDMSLFKSGQFFFQCPILLYWKQYGSSDFSALFSFSRRGDSLGRANIRYIVAGISRGLLIYYGPGTTRRRIVPAYWFSRFYRFLIRRSLFSYSIYHSAKSLIESNFLSSRLFNNSIFILSNRLSYWSSGDLLSLVTRRVKSTQKTGKGLSLYLSFR